MEDHIKLSDSQNGFRRCRSTIDHLTTLTFIVECRQSQYKATYAAFIDLRKAYDKVDRQKLWYRLRAARVTGTFYNSIISLYDITMSYVKFESIIRTGLRLIEGSDRDVICPQLSSISLLPT